MTYLYVAGHPYSPPTIPLPRRSTSIPSSFCAALKVVTFAVSLGHDESLIFPQPSYDERINLYPEKFRKGFIRFSIGLEDPDDIIGDLNQALKAIGL